MVDSSKDDQTRSVVNLGAYRGAKSRDMMYSVLYWGGVTLLAAWSLFAIVEIVEGL